jgi:tripartite-type tricarboxylate transporter receptor subunit TctC
VSAFKDGIQMNQNPKRRISRSMRGFALFAAVCALLSACGEGGSTSEATERPLEGKQVNLVVGFDPGGGFDTYARVAARYLAEELGATVVVQNTPGAGGLLALKQMLASKPDGTTLNVINAPGIAAATVAEAEGVDFGVGDLAYIGRFGDYTNVVVTDPDSTFESFEDVLDAPNEFRWAADGPGGSLFLGPTVLMGLFDEEPNIIAGYDGSQAVHTAAAAGEADGAFGAEETLKPFVDSGDLEPLLIVGPERSSFYPDTPTLLEQELTDDQETIARAYFSLVGLGRTLVAHPDTPDELLTSLREAMAKVIENPEFIADIEDKGYPVVYADAEELDSMVDDIENAPPRFVELMKASY